MTWNYYLHALRLVRDEYTAGHHSPDEFRRICGELHCAWISWVINHVEGKR